MATRTTLVAICIFICFLTPSPAQQPSREADQIRGAMEFLASDVLQGRGSGSRDELLAATYLASQLRQIGIEPAGDDGGYLQTVSGEFNFFREGKKQWNTRNVIGVLRGRDDKLKDQVLLLTACAGAGCIWRCGPFAKPSRF